MSETPRSKKDRKSKSKSKPLWRETMDKATGRFYYYNTKTRETTWTKPIELSDPEERKARENSEKEKMSFFSDMENNMKAKMKAGLTKAEIARASGHQIPAAAAEEERAARKAEEASMGPMAFSPDLTVTQRTVRTISTVDDLVLEQAKRSTIDDFDCSDDTNQSRRKDTKDHAALFDDLERGGCGGGGGAQAGGSAGDNAVAKRLSQRRNTSSTIFVDSTLSSPDKEATITCVCTVLRAHMLEASLERDKTPEHPKASVFHDLEFTSSKQAVALGSVRVPGLSTLCTFFIDVFTKSQMESECVIMSLVYMERLTRETKGSVQVRPYNWKSLLVSAMIMSSKVWDDLSMWNADFSQVCPSFNLKRINELELALLEFLRYSVKVSASDYAKYYFHLRSYSAKLGLSTSATHLTPLNMAGAKRLAVLSKVYEKGAKAAMKARCSTMPDRPPSSSLVKSAGEGGRDRGAASESKPSRLSEQASLEQVAHVRKPRCDTRVSPEDKWRFFAQRTAKAEQRRALFDAAVVADTP